MGDIRVVSRSDEAFADRWEAGRMLAAELQELRDHRAVVLGIPRGGPIVARAVAQEIGGELDVVLVRKLRAPHQPELAIGSVTEAGEVLVSHELLSRMGVPQTYIEQEQARQMTEIRRRQARYRAERPKVSLNGRVTVIVDDGLATGSTMRAALQSARAEGPLRLIAAVPVASQGSLESIAPSADEILCLRVPPLFRAVGEFYRAFPQVSDQEVLDVLRRQPTEEEPR